ncbi:chemotaxis protein CheA [Anaerophilus nitritogenes]|uniref:chemotaxis protein CheA n=1 Tax=Anaerophilus nitritogenes TaxID=2498136 RepID=UPI00101BBDF6|nr:chemotaxis protein CheA [Anaerophilus nitritogenes]
MLDYIPMLDMYIFETSQLIEQLESIAIESEGKGEFTQEEIHEIFRCMHNIKGSSAMMLFNEIEVLAHSMEDLFYFIREKQDIKIDNAVICDLILEEIDFIQGELEKIKKHEKVDGNPSLIIEKINNYLNSLKDKDCLEKEIKQEIFTEKPQYYIAPDLSKISEKHYKFRMKIFFEDRCEMENIRAFTMIQNLKNNCETIKHIPEDIIDEDSTEKIRENGFEIWIKTDKEYDEIYQMVNKTIFLKSLEIEELEEEYKLEDEIINHNPQTLIVNSEDIKIPKMNKENIKTEDVQCDIKGIKESFMSVHVKKLDHLMDLMGEMVIAEAMVTQNPEIQNMELENFNKAARQLHKITNEIQDVVMSIRMVPLSNTFMKMHRITRDMCKKLNKDVQLKLIGEDTEVDKNIIEHISDPIMHLIRNAIDHGIEHKEERIKKQKEFFGTVTLEAKNSGSDVLIIVQDDGKGLSKEKILQKAQEKNLLTKPIEEMTDKEIYNLIVLPGFSTKENVTEFSGRGVGMDVVAKGLEEVRGTLSVDSIEGEGTTIIMEIPLTLAIIDGMNVKVGTSKYTIPIISIQESFRPEKEHCIKDPDGNEMVMIRGECYPIVRLYEYYHVKTNITELSAGILVIVKQDQKSIALFVDELIGQQQVVVKSLPQYIKQKKNIKGLAGCTLLGDGSISLILDIQNIF